VRRQAAKHRCPVDESTHVASGRTDVFDRCWDCHLVSVGVRRSACCEQGWSRSAASDRTTTRPQTFAHVTDIGHSPDRHWAAADSQRKHVDNRDGRAVAAVWNRRRRRLQRRARRGRDCQIIIYLSIFMSGSTMPYYILMAVMLRFCHAGCWQKCPIRMRIHSARSRIAQWSWQLCSRTSVEITSLLNEFMVLSNKYL